MANPTPSPFILERVFYIPELVDTNPEGNDPLEFCDDHIRLIKNVLKNNFPNFDAAIITDGTFWGYFQKIFNMASTEPWLPNTAYIIDARVENDGANYKCITAHTSGATFNPVYWALFEDGLNSGWISLTGIYTPAATFPDENLDLKSIPKTLTVASDGKVSAVEPDFVLGVPFYTMLTVAEMTNIYGANKYVLCDGADYPDSMMFKETGISRVPNLISPILPAKEYYPRATATASEVGTFVESSTGKEGLNITSAQVSHDHSGGAHTHGYLDSAGWYYDGDLDDKDPQHNTSQIETTQNTVANGFTPDDTPYVHNHNPILVEGTDTETTPIHFYANYLIRIN